MENERRKGKRTQEARVLISGLKGVAAEYPVISTS